MTEPVTASGVSSVGVASILERLAAAYFDRLAAGDWARASVCLTTFADTFNQHRAALIAYVQQYSPRPNFSLIPASVTPTFTVNTRRALQAVLVLGPAGTRIVSIVEAMPTTPVPAQIYTWWRQLAPQLTIPTLEFTSAVASDSVRTLATNLASRVNAAIHGGAAEVIRDERETPFDTPTPDVAPTPPVVPVPTMVIVPSRWTMPTWGWWAIGIGAVAAIGVVTYGAVERGWFD